MHITTEKLLALAAVAIAGYLIGKHHATAPATGAAAVEPATAGDWWSYAGAWGG